jgi:Arc/MetJ-type ribon-helix-helix transcriptional regulator
MGTRTEAIVTKPMTLNVGVSGALGAFVAANVGEGGVYGNVGEYVRDLIRREKARAEPEDVERLGAELTLAFAAPDGARQPVDADGIVRRDARPERA